MSLSRFIQVKKWGGCAGRRTFEALDGENEVEFLSDCTAAVLQNFQQVPEMSHGYIHHEGVRCLSKASKMHANIRRQHRQACVHTHITHIPQVLII